MPNPHFERKHDREELCQILDDSFDDTQIVQCVKSMPEAELKEFIKSLAHFYDMESEIEHYEL